jgi:pimeloyl-ACP methyl ester carboxylesterase
MNRPTVVGIAIAIAGFLAPMLVDPAAPVVRKMSFFAWRRVSSEAHGGRYADINSIRIYYEIYGQGAPVLVLHGGAGSIEDMHNQIRALAATRLVIAVDSRGHGRSTDADAPLAYALMASDMLQLLDDLKISRTDIGGWSDGGIIALALAMRAPERVARLVVIGANYDVDGLIHLPAADARAPPRSRLDAPENPGPDRRQALYQKVVTMWRTQPHYTLGELGHIKAPTLIIAGEFDLIKRKHSDELAQAIPGGQEDIIEGATHFAISDRPDMVNADILRFFSRAPP